jgi:hypothetical protein
MASPVAAWLQRRTSCHSLGSSACLMAFLIRRGCLKRYAKQTPTPGQNSSLWLEQGPFGHVPPSRQLVATDVRGFRALAVPDWVWVLDNERNLWLCSSPFGSTRQQIDGNVLAFQPLDIDHVVVLGTDGNLWLEQAPFGHVPPSRQQIDGNVMEFAATDENNVLVLGTDGQLWWEQAPWNVVPPHRQLIDGTVA